MSHTVYKVNHYIEKNVIDKVYVFFGHTLDQKEQSKWIPKIFPEEELALHDEKTEIIFLEQKIYPDDSIEDVYKKVYEILPDEVAFQELYLFAELRIFFDCPLIYKMLTENGKKQLLKQHLLCLFQNMNMAQENQEKLLSQIMATDYPFLSEDELIHLGLQGKEFTVKNEIGVLNWTQYTNIVNPFEFTTFFDNLPEKQPTKKTNVLMDTGFIQKNTLHLCLARDVLTQSEENNIPDSLILQNYYSDLQKEFQISSLKSLVSKGPYFAKTQKDKILDLTTMNYFETIDMFHEIFIHKTSSLPYKTKGVTSVTFQILPTSLFHINLEHIFSVIHASSQYPFLRFDKKVKLFGNTFTEEGHVIPSLDTTTLLQLKEYKLTDSEQVHVLVFSQFEKKETNIDIFCAFMADGTILCSFQCKNNVTLGEIEMKKILDDYINPLIQLTGQQYKPFDNFMVNHIKVLSLNLFFELENLKTPLQPNIFDGCFSSVFKKIESKSESESKQSFQFSFLRTSREKGFPVFIQLNESSKSIEIRVENINNIQYFFSIPIYIDTFIRLQEDKTSTKYPQKRISSLCNLQSSILPSLPFIQRDDDEIDNELNKYKNIGTDDIGKNEYEFDYEYDDNNPQKIYSFGEMEEEEEQFGGATTTFDLKPDLLYSTTKYEDIDDEDEDENEDEDEDEEDINNGIEDDYSIDDDSLDDDSLDYNTEKEKKEKEDKNPIIVLQKYKNRYQSFSRICPSTFRRQPIGVTDEELEAIKKEQPDLLLESDVLNYSKNTNFICPRYWCLKTNKPINPSELTRNSQGELEHPTCGKVLPWDATEMLPGYHIFEFYKDGEKRYPGTDNGCSPCCQDFPATKTTSTTECTVLESPDTFPLQQGQWGYLPTSLQYLFPFCTSQNKPCFMRHGIEFNDKQSFLAAISDALFFSPEDKKTSKVLNIQDMRERLKKSVTLDSFLRLQNGSLVQDFATQDKSMNESEYESLVRKYKNSIFLSKLNLREENERNIFKKVASAFQNFQSFLSNPNVKIDFKYIWDLVCEPNSFLFGKVGINLVILELAKDMTNNVSIVCPSNHYSSTYFKDNRPTLILLKRGSIFEPLYEYSEKGKKQIVTKLHFSRNNAFINKIVKPYLILNCKPVQSLPFIYKAKQSTLLEDVVQELTKAEIKIKKQVMGTEGKIIGVICENKGGNGFVPCFPSSPINDNYISVFQTKWFSYVETVTFLRRVAAETNITCQPKFFVQEDALVVGILTEADQFVQISEPIEVSDIPSDLRLIPIRNKNLKYSNSVDGVYNADTEREEAINDIELESRFYNLFKDETRKMLLDSANLPVKEQIEMEINDTFADIQEKRKRVGELLASLIASKIQFVGDKEFFRLFSKNQKSLYLSTENGQQLILPEMNMVTKKNNHDLYLARLSDDLVRNKKISYLFLNPKQFVDFVTTDENLQPGEMVTLTKNLTKEYLDSLREKENNFKTDYDNAEPLIEVSLDLLDCRSKQPEQMQDANLWSFCFHGDGFQEIVYKKNCFDGFVKDLVNWKTGEHLNNILNPTFEEIVKILKEKFIPVLFLSKELLRENSKLLSTVKSLNQDFVFVSLDAEKEMRVVFDNTLNSVFIPLSKITNPLCFQYIEDAINL